MTDLEMVLLAKVVYLEAQPTGWLTGAQVLDHLVRTLEHYEADVTSEEFEEIAYQANKLGDWQIENLVNQARDRWVRLPDGLKRQV